MIRLKMGFTMRSIIEWDRIGWIDSGKRGSVDFSWAHCSLQRKVSCVVSPSDLNLRNQSDMCVFPWSYAGVASSIYSAFLKNWLCQVRKWVRHLELLAGPRHVKP